MLRIFELPTYPEGDFDLRKHREGVVFSYQALERLLFTVIDGNRERQRVGQLWNVVNNPEEETVTFIIHHPTLYNVPEGGVIYRTSGEVVLNGEHSQTIIDSALINRRFHNDIGESS